MLPPLHLHVQALTALFLAPDVVQRGESEHTGVGRMHGSAVPFLSATDSAVSCHSCPCDMASSSQTGSLVQRVTDKRSMLEQLPGHS